MEFMNTWLIKEHVMISNIVTVEAHEIETIEREILNMENATPSPVVHHVVNVGQLEKIPTNIMQIQKHMAHYRHPKMGWLVVVGINNPIIAFLTQVLPQITGIKCRAVPNMDEALEVLFKIDPTLKDLPIERVFD